MSFASPWALALAIAAAAGVALLHFLARRHRAAPLPTARFIPDAAASATARAAYPTDRLLLAVRALALLLIGTAFAAPTWQPGHRSLARVVMLDVSRAVADPAAARDSAVAWLTDGGTMVVFDSTARVVPRPEPESIAVRGATSAAGSLSVALLAAYRAASQHEAADSVELVLVSPLVADQWDTATATIRSLWPGRVRLVRTSAAGPDVAPPAGEPEIEARPADVLRATMALLGPVDGGTSVRIQRGELTDSDLQFARQPGRVLVHWKEDETEERPREEVGAVIAGEVVVVASFERIGPPGEGRVVARWVDGTPAAVERAEGDGCVREVAIPLPAEGDLVLRGSMRRLVKALLAPCGGTPLLEPLDEARVGQLVGTGGAVSLDRPRQASVAPTRLSTALLAAALLLLLIETGARRRRRMP